MAKDVMTICVVDAATGETITRPMTAEEVAEYNATIISYEPTVIATITETRRNAYAQTADPLYFGWQRGDNTEQEWLDAVQAVKDANPYPVK